MGNNGWTSPAIPAGYTTTCYQINVPDNDEHRRAFFGALNELTRAYNWDTDGDDAKADELATYWRHLLFYEVSEGCADDTEEDDAPWWDDIVSMAGEGEGTKWGYEEIADWAITAFLAAAGSPAAAVFYKTTVPRARIAFQSMDLGSIVNIFIDGILFGAVNTASTVSGVAEIIEVPIDLVEFAAEHSLTGTERIIRLIAA